MLLTLRAARLLSNPAIMPKPKINTPIPVFVPVFVFFVFIFVFFGEYLIE
jgi:hypothetical protein